MSASVRVRVSAPVELIKTIMSVKRYNKPRGSSRPNVEPARKYSNANRSADLIDGNIFRKNSKYRRLLIIDVCDFCKKEIPMRRSSMRFLKKRFKFACWKCYKNKGFKFKVDKVIKQFMFPKEK